MLLQCLDRRRSVSTTTGTGDFTLTAGTGPWTEIDFDDLDVEPFGYCIVLTNGTEWEVGRGHLSGAGILVRDYVLDSSVGVSGPSQQIDFSAGPKEVFLTLPALSAYGALPLTEGAVLRPGYQETFSTTDATPNTQASPFTGYYYNATGSFEINVIATTSDAKCKAWKITYIAVYDGVDYTIYGKDKTVMGESESLTWDVDVSIVAGHHIVAGTGAAATNIDWYIAGCVKAEAAAWVD